MNCLKLSLTFLLVGFWAGAKDVYEIRHLSERELLNTYTSLLVEGCDYSERFWKVSSFDSEAGYWGDGASDGNQGIRAISEMVFVSGTLLKYPEAFPREKEAEVLSKTKAAIRFACATHLTGMQKCPDGKSWGGSWQSAMWTATLGFGAWLVWDKLDDESKRNVERVIASETDRFLPGKPPGGTTNDTKAEENGWNLICISLAENMFPNHPHAALWHDKAIEYMVNTLSVAQDRTNKSILDGRPMCDWFSGENLFPDFTLENHGFFHPAYVACSSYFMTQSAMHYTYAHRPIPQAATHHLLDVWRMFQAIILPQGEPAYPQGMDWELHGIPLINLFASLASYQKDPLAAMWEENYLQYMRAWQEMERGSLATPGSRLGFTRHAICAEQAAYGFLAHKIFGPPVKEISAQKAASELCSVRTLDSVGLVMQRTEKKLASFSWKNRIGGMLIPIEAGHEGQPFFTAPIPNGFIGSFEVSPKQDSKIQVVDHAVRTNASGFETSGTLLLDNGRLEQKIRVTSLGKSLVIYQDRVKALSDVSISAERGVPVGIENDKVTGGKRTLFFQGGEEVFDFKKPRPPVPISGTWANVDGRLGIITVASSGINYVQARGYHPGMGICADFLYASGRESSKSFKVGEEVAQRAVIFLVESN